jgi:hypothetical protein
VIFELRSQVDFGRSFHTQRLRAAAPH